MGDRSGGVSSREPRALPPCHGRVTIKDSKDPRPESRLLQSYTAEGEDRPLTQGEETRIDHLGLRGSPSPTSTHHSSRKPMEAINTRHLRGLLGSECLPSRREV